MQEIKPLNQADPLHYSKEMALAELDQLYKMAIAHEKLSDAIRVVSLKLKLYGIANEVGKTEIHFDLNDELKKNFQEFFEEKQEIKTQIIEQSQN